MKVMNKQKDKSGDVSAWGTPTLSAQHHLLQHALFLKIQRLHVAREQGNKRKLSKKKRKKKKPNTPFVVNFTRKGRKFT